eukprot:scaffold3352_cov326-Prasinococcus_capsulatus_cf.AAC.7
MRWQLPSKRLLRSSTSRRVRLSEFWFSSARASLPSVPASCTTGPALNVRPLDHGAGCPAFLATPAIPPNANSSRLGVILACGLGDMLRFIVGVSTLMPHFACSCLHSAFIKAAFPEGSCDILRRLWLWNITVWSTSESWLAGGSVPAGPGKESCWL